MKMKLQLRKGKEKSKNLCQEKFKKKSAVLYPEPESNRQGRALPTELLPHLCFRHELFQKRRKDKNSPINYTSFQGLKFLFFFHY